MIEVLGIVATLFILLAFSFNDPKKIRIIDMVGAALFVIYGTLIKSLSVSLLNGCLILIHLYKLKNDR